MDPEGVNMDPERITQPADRPCELPLDPGDEELLMAARLDVLAEDERRRQQPVAGPGPTADPPPANGMAMRPPPGAT